MGDNPSGLPVRPPEPTDPKPEQPTEDGLHYWGRFSWPKGYVYGSPMMVEVPIDKPLPEDLAGME